MSYIEQNWVDGETVIDAQHLNHIEQGIGRCSVSIQGLEAELGTQGQELTGLKAELELKIDSKDVYTKQELDSKLSSVYEYKGSVATEQDLPESGEVGDVYNVESTGMNYGWSGTKWDSLGSFVDLGPYLKVEQADQKFATLTQLEALTTKVEGKQEQGDYLTVEQADDKFATKDSLDNYVFWTQFTAGADPSLRNTIQLANHDSISGLTVEGKGVNLIMVSRWDKVDIGSPSLIANLNAKDGVVQINDDKVIATVDQIPSMLEIATSTEMVEMFTSMQTKIDNKVSELTYDADKIALDQTIATMQESIDNKQPAGDYALKSELPAVDEFITKTGAEEQFAPKQLVIQIPIRTLEDKVYTKEQIFGWFKCKDEIDLKTKMTQRTIPVLYMCVTYSSLPHVYTMAVQYLAFESQTQVKLVCVGLDTKDDTIAKYTIVMNLDGTVFEGTQSNVKLEMKDLEI